MYGDPIHSKTRYLRHTKLRLFCKRVEWRWNWTVNNCICFVRGGPFCGCTGSTLCAIYDLAYVSVTVTSQVTHLPLCHGTKEAPSGLLPLLSRHSGSLIACILALVIVRHTMSFKMLCRVCLPEFFKHEKQCNPRASIVCPHWQTCGRHIVAPRRRATAIRTVSLRTVSLSRKRPQLDNGSACNQSAECWSNAASKRAWSMSVVQSDSKLVLTMFTYTSSYARCLFALLPVMGCPDVNVVQNVKLSVKSVSGMHASMGRISWKFSCVCSLKLYH